MEITFTRNGERGYTTVVVRDDGVRLHVPSYDRMSPLPHDLAHYVVERELGLARGFWGSIATGVLFPGMKVLSGRQPPHAAERSRAILREAGQQGIEAEVLVGVLMQIMEKGLEKDWAAASALLRNEWRPSKPARGPLEAEEVRQVCGRLRDMQHRWQALSLGQSITVFWPLGKRISRKMTL